MRGYDEFLARRGRVERGGFSPVWMPDFLFDFQRLLVDWSLVQGRAGIFADCGMGKTPMQLIWAENVVRHTNKPVLVATPLAVSYQTVEEARKFGIEAVRVSDGRVRSGARVVVTNYQRLHHFDPVDFGGMVADESSVLKNFNGVTKALITDFMTRLPYRLLCTATAAPNDYIELGTSSEALGELGHMDMLSRFFRNDRQNADVRRSRGQTAQWRFKGHAEEPFWRWVSSWGRAIRKPSDYGFEDDGFVLPPLMEVEHVVEAKTVREGWLFDMPAITLPEQREERRRTIPERCDKVAGLVDHEDQALVWCHLNAEGDRLTQDIPGAVQVSGSDEDEAKEERLLAFAHGQIRVLVTKPKIGAWGLNLQNCAHTVTFPSHSYEQYYQSVRRFWRFGQKRPVTVDIVLSEAEERVLQNLQRKSKQADQMFSALLRHMQDAMMIREANPFTTKERVPSWL